MIRDTFKTNPGLCELFKRKILERARFVGLSEGLIDFKAQIDMEGTYQDNLRILYREYPQLSQNSDYSRIKSVRLLSGAALEQSWRSYERNNGHEIPELLEDGERILSFPVNTFQSIIDCVTAMVGEKVTKMILHQIGQEIGSTAFNCSRDQILSDNLAEALDRVLSIRGWGQVLDLEKTDHGSRVTYVCTVKGCPLCYKRGSTSPTCDIMLGIVSGWLKSLVQKNVERIENACVATGSAPCVFQVTFRK